MQAVVTQTSKAKTKRPNGADPTRYKDCHKWSYREWAWEFMRRNTSYIDACRRVRNRTDEEKQQVADEFRLKAFKDSIEGYYGGNGVPRFCSGIVTLKSNLDAGQNKRGYKLIKIAHGQVGVRFDLNHALQNSNALVKQLRVVRRVLLDRLREFERVMGREAKPARFKPGFFVRHIRILDCLNSGNSHYETAKIIFPGMTNTERDILKEKIKPMIKSAKEHSESKYQFLSVLQGRPIIKPTKSTS